MPLRLFRHALKLWMSLWSHLATKVSLLMVGSSDYSGLLHVQELGDIWSAVDRQGGAALSLKVSTQLAEMASLLGGISAKAGLTFALQT